MRTSLLTGMLVLLAVLAFSINPLMAQCSKKCAPGACPNVTTCTMGGEMSAVCACGMEFKVTDTTPFVEKDGKKYYVCSEACAEKIKADPDKLLPVMEMKAKEARKNAKVGGNVMCIDDEGNRHAMCTCGMDMKVSESTVTREFNGETFYFCHEKCAEAFDKDPEGACKVMHEKMMMQMGEKAKEM